MENIEALKDYNSSLLSLVETYQAMCADLRGHIVRLERSNTEKQKKLWSVESYVDKCYCMLLCERNTIVALNQTEETLRTVRAILRDKL